MALMALLALSALGPQVAMAWTRIGETPEVALFVNRNSIEKADRIRKVWEMQDLKTADADGVRSRRYLNEYDCEYKMHRVGQMTSYAGPKMTGQVVATVNEMGYWRKIPPDGVFVLTYIAVCIQ
jgi:hypothetical protein